MSYTQSAIDSLAQLWSGLSGLDLSVAKAQVTAEQGVNGNVLGLTVKNGAATDVYPGQTGAAQAPNGQWLATFATPQQGIIAAAYNLKVNSAYTGLRQAIATGNAAIQANALANSPWGPPGYYRGSSAFSSLLSATPGPPASPSPSASTGFDLNPLDWIANLNAGVQQMHTDLGNPSAPGLAAVPEPNTVSVAAQAAVGAAGKAAATAASGLIDLSGLTNAINGLPAGLAAAAAPLAIGLVILLVIAWLALSATRDVLPIAA